MEAVFLKLVNMSITASWLVLAILAVRLVFRRTPKWLLCLLWALVALRLICPFSIESALSLIPSAEPLPQEILYTAQPEINSGLAVIDNAVNPILKSTMTPAAPVSTNPTPDWSFLLSAVWLSGMVLMLLYMLVSYQLLRRKVAAAIPMQRGIKQSEFVESPFVLGIIRPVIYLPFGMDEQDMVYVIAHEKAHIRRKDHWWKPMGFLLLSVYWFNPVLWVAYILLCRDIEAACDEKVIRNMEKAERRAYSNALLNCSIRHRVIAACPLAFGETGVKIRIKTVMNYRKPGFWVVLAAAVLSLVVAICFLTDPKEEKSIEELTRRTASTPVYTGIGDLYFTYPAGLTSEQREVENWTKEEQRRILRGEANRNQWDHFFIDNGVDFGGVVDFLVPDDRQIALKELNLPSEWKDLDYIGGSSTYPYAEMEYTLVKDGKDYIQLYLYTYSGRGYFLWFYADQGDPVHKQAILNSVELGTGSRTKTKLEQDEELSLGLFNITVPKGYGYYKNETVILEITKKDRFRDYSVVGCVTARPNPNLPIESADDLSRWVEAVGVDIHMENTSSGYHITDEGEYGDISLTLEALEDGKTVMAENHYFFIAGDIVYDLWLDAIQLDSKDEKKILESIWLKESGTILSENKWVTTAGASPVQIGLLPAGYNYGFDKDQNIVFAWGSNAVGGVKTYPIPEGVYDPYDRNFFWLEEMGIPDFEDPSLLYVGGMTSGDKGWLAEFASDVPPGTPATVHRRHTFKVVGDTLYDIWFDRLHISLDTSQEILSAIHLPAAIEADSGETSEEDIAFEKCNSVMEAVAEGSCHIISLEERQEGTGYERNYLYHDGDLLYTNRLLTQSAAEYSRDALLIVGDDWFTNAAHRDVPGDILWERAEPMEPKAPWLGNHIWVKSFVSYMGTTNDAAGNTVYLWRYDKMYEDQEGYLDYYYVNLTFDPDGEFLNAAIQVNLFTDTGFTVTESIVTLDPEAVNAGIQMEYQRAIG